ncbi:unnamed protein product [Spirodela intermedia]|uniref:Uncharacterized protein n=1 Tax=Spirodela intermedia TaxID=51605 RepID=A0A7I8LGX8_SPIIN|nr:unnamed protein product [Spirodela intermedia]
MTRASSTDRRHRPSLMAPFLIGAWSVPGNRLRGLFYLSRRQLSCTARPFLKAVVRRYQWAAASADPFLLLLMFFVANSFVGFLLLMKLGPKPGRVGTGDLDLFFTAVSAATVSSMSTTQMEAFSRGQVFVLILLMLTGGEGFTSLLHNHLIKAKITRENRKADPAMNIGEDVSISIALELPISGPPASPTVEIEEHSDTELRYQSMNLLSMAIFGYVVGSISLGFAAIVIYLAFFAASEAREVLTNKGIHIVDFSIFLSVSSFTNCGFVLTNENMLPFRKSSGLLLLIIPLILAGNCFFPPGLRSVLWSWGRLVRKRRETLDDLLTRRDGRHLGFDHLFGKRRCVHLVLTTAALIGVQFIIFVCLEWDSDVLRGSDLSTWQKAAAVLFQSVNSRHAGESVFDMSVISPAILVLYVVMMYLPPYTSVSPEEDEISVGQRRGGRRSSDLLLSETLILSHLGYIAIFVMAVCVTERTKFVQDALNFNVFNIAFEVVSAYGNVGLSMGYSCGRRLKEDGSCKDEWYGFAGRWSDGGKMVLIGVMLVGRLKRFNKRGGSAWKLT